MAYLEYAPHRTLYHYTSIDGFKGITGSKHLWFSDLAKTNDPREIHFGHGLIMSAISHVRHNDYPGEKGIFLSIIAGHLATYLEKSGILSCSFSHIGDSLPMWRAYTEEGAGIAIGFRPTAITDMPIRIQKVKYLKDDSEEELRNLIREVAKPFEGPRETWSDKKWIDASVAATSAVVSAKHHTWEYEREVRGTHAAIDVDGNTIIDGERVPSYIYPDGQKIFTSLLFRQAIGESVKYVPLPFGRYRSGKHRWERSIEELVLGPKCQLTEDDICKIMMDQGFADFRVRRSECQIR